MNQNEKDFLTKFISYYIWGNIKSLNSNIPILKNEFYSLEVIFEKGFYWILFTFTLPNKQVWIRNSWFIVNQNTFIATDKNNYRILYTKDLVVINLNLENSNIFPYKIRNFNLWTLDQIAFFLSNKLIQRFDQLLFTSPLLFSWLSDYDIFQIKQYIVEDIKKRLNFKGLK